jgi:ubiquinol-cytochrome c reductase cytochrome c1 subunit
MRARKALAARAASIALGVLALAASAHAAGDATPPRQHWSFQGIFGTFDRAALQRGYQVYKEVCAGCHGMQYLYYRHLKALGFNDDEVKALAAGYEVTDGPNDQGEMFKRPGQPSDRFVSPFANEKAARAANGGAFPPDLTLMTKARDHGADYVYALLTGYKDPPAGVMLLQGTNYNVYFPGNRIAMPPPLSDGAVTYADGTKADVAQMARDVTTFMSWAAEPELEARKQMGIKTILFLIVFTGLLYAVKRKVWKGVH